MEGGLLLATLMQRVELSVVPEFKFALSPAITMRMRDPLRVRTERRRD